MSEKRVETFVFEFKDQETFKKFFDEYYHALPACGIECLGASSENLIKKEDELLQLIGELYDVAQIGKRIRDNEIMEKAEKLLGI